MKAVKEKVLDEIMDLMDEEDGKRLLKHPKVVAAKVSIAKPLAKPEPEAEEEMPMEEDMEMDEDMMGALEGIEGIEDLEGLDLAKKEKILKMLLK